MRLVFVAVLVLAAALAPAVHAAAPSPTAHAAAVCADYPNQAAAQRAADTRDSDGDGIYCEDLPCPCLKPGQNTGGGTGGATKPRPTPKAPATFLGKCRRGTLPDHRCTPGVVATMSVERICTPGYSQSVRNVSESTKNKVYWEYGIRRHSRGQYEIDHLIPLELGGSNSIRNLFAESASPKPGFHQKDVLENRLHSLVCAGDLKIRAAQRAIATNWLKAYKRYIGRSASVSRMLCTAARIGGQRKCLQRGQFCTRSYQRQYRHYGFSCSKRDRNGRYRLQ
jgi:hypothetical protein